MFGEISLNQVLRLFSGEAEQDVKLIDVSRV